jgi:hypothetical protein
VEITQTLGRGAAGFVGAALGAVFGATARIRPTAKPLHPRGFQVTGTLHRHGSDRTWGVPWLDEPGSEPVLVRFSRALGLPGPLPDILGLTVRIQRPDGDADLLLATTGRGVYSRMALVPRRDLAAGYGSLMAYRTPAGPAWLLAEGEADEARPRRLRLSAGDRAGTWWPFADIDLAAGTEDMDPTVSFDPIIHPLPGLELYAWEQRLRESAYAAARSARS